MILEPSILVIFGITGDLASRKLLPALYQLDSYGLLPKQLKIIGVTRRGTTVEAVLGKVRTALQTTGQPYDATRLTALGTLIEIVTMDMLDEAAYTQLGNRLAAIEDAAGVCMTQLFYLAVPAQSFGTVADRLAAAGLNKSCRHSKPTRLLIEKPFGYDVASAKELVIGLDRRFDESQIYRIDHYLAKETVQNILTFRFQNPIFKQIWNNRSISRITITAAETIGIEGRAAFYEQTGALRDLLQSHLLQLLALATMDEPAELSAVAIHHQKLALLQNVTPLAPNDVATHAVRGQYAGYRDEAANPDSLVETFAAVRLGIDSERWRDVPIVLCTGKALRNKGVTIEVTFGSSKSTDEQNVLTIRIQPDEGIGLQLLAKKPGLGNETEPVLMNFSYGQSFDAGQADPYARVLIDAFKGDKTLFATSEEVVACWRIVDAVIHEWAKNDTGLHFYGQGSAGPPEADILTRKLTGTLTKKD